MTRKIKISESDLYNIIKQVLVEQEEEKVIKFSPSEFESFMLIKKHDKFVNALNINYNEVVVSGSLYLVEMTSITSLPNNLYVAGTLNLFKTPIRSLPNNLYVSGRLDLEQTLITSLPDNLVVKDEILIHGTPLNDNDELVEEYEAKGYKINRDAY